MPKQVTGSSKLRKFLVTQKINAKQLTKYGKCNPLTKRQTNRAHACRQITHTHYQQQHEYAKTGLMAVMANPAAIQQSGNWSKRC